MWVHTESVSNLFTVEQSPVYLQPAKKTKKNDGEAAPKAAAKSEVDTSATKGSTTIFCKNLPWTASDEDLAGFFADCGTATQIRIGQPPSSLLAVRLLTVCCMRHCCFHWCFRL